MKRVLDITGVQMDLGASKRGVSMGPMAIRYGGLCEGLMRLGFQVNDLGDIVPKPTGATRDTLRNYEQVIDVNRRLHQQVLSSLAAGHFPVVLGGDHSIAAGSISAVARHYGKIGVIWIDAHGDWNNEESSLTGNMHGMPFSAVCGFGPDCMAVFEADPVVVDPRRCVQIGGRDLDEQEKVRMKASGLGTPATRAAILERLIQVGYVKRQGKTLVSTQKGRDLVRVVPDEIRSAETTGKWERALYTMAQADAETAQRKAQRFLESIGRFSAFLVQSAVRADHSVKFEKTEFRRIKSRKAPQKPS